MSRGKIKEKILDEPLFQIPELHQKIWESIPEEMQNQVIQLMSNIIIKYQKQKNQRGAEDE